MLKDTLYEIEQVDSEPAERYPFFIRVYGVLSIVGSVLQIVAFVLGVVALATGRLQPIAVNVTSMVTIVVSVVSLLLSAALVIMFLVLGIRLVRGKRAMAAVIANSMIAVEVAVMLCQLMLSGVGVQLISPAVNIVILIALETYSDPALRDERRLQHRLQQLEIKAQAEDGTLGLDTTGKGYITLNFYNLFWVFVICSILGLCIEVIYHLVVVDPGVYQDRAGLLYGPFSPIYGVGGALMTIALNRFHDKNFAVIFLVSAIIGGAFEFFVSWFMETSFGITAWDYTGTFLSIGGRTNGMFMAMWGALGLFWVRWCLPAMLKVVNKVPWNWRYTLTAVCAALMFADSAMTLASLDCWYQREAGAMDYENASAIVQFCNEHYDDNYMASRFQSMTLNADSAVRAG